MSKRLENINIVDRLSIHQFKKDYTEYCNYEVKAAVFLTYSVEPKVILGLIQDLFFAQEGEVREQKKTKEETAAMIGEILKNIYGENPREDDLRGKFAVFYNNGSKPVEEKITVADTVAMKFAYPVTVKSANFHPKVYIVKYGPKDGQGASVYRFIIGSHNLSNSGCIEYGYSFDREETPADENVNVWSWFDSLLEGVNIHDYKGKEIVLGEAKEEALLRVIEEIKSCNLNLPEIIVKDFGRVLNNKLIKGSEVFTPFISSEELAKCEASIFTTHMELVKRGFELCEETYQGEKHCFYVFSPVENSVAAEYTIPHFKVYVLPDKVYAGSLNFTNSAFSRNKEMLVELPEKPDFKPIKAWYEERYYYKKDYVSDTEGSIGEAFKNIIRKNLENGTLQLEKQEKEYLVKLFFEKEKVQSAKKDVEKLKNNLQITIRPEYVFSRMELKEETTWKIPFQERSGLRSSLICFELWEGERLITSYARSYVLSEGDELLKQVTEEADIMSFFRIHLGITVGAEPEGSSVKTGKINPAQWREHLKLLSLEELLRVDSKLRQEKINVMKLKLDLLDYVIKCAQEEKEGEKVLLRLGCAAGDALICNELITQAKQICVAFEETEN